MTAPEHYDLGEGRDALDVMRACMGPGEYRGFLRGNVLKYAIRLGRKDDAAADSLKLLEYAERLAWELNPHEG